MLATRSPTVNPPVHFDNKWRNEICRVLCVAAVEGSREIHRNVQFSCRYLFVENPVASVFTMISHF